MVDIWEDLSLLIQTSGELLLEFPNNLCSHGWGQFLTLFESREDQPEGEERLIKMKSPGPIIFLRQVAAGFEKWLCCPAKFWLFAWLDDKAIHDFKQCRRLQIFLVEKNPAAIGGHYNFWSGVSQIRFYTYVKELQKYRLCGRKQAIETSKTGLYLKHTFK